jgi:glycosyltransferase involved in cell wall biosynthesis
VPSDAGNPRVGWVADAAWPPRSGIGNHAWHLMDALGRLGAPPYLIHRDGKPPLDLAAAGEIALPGWTGRRFVRRFAPPLFRPVRELDVIHFPTEFDLWYLRPGRARRVVTIHGCAPAVMPAHLHHRLRAGLIRRMARHLSGVDQVVTVSEASAREIESVYGLPRSRVEVIPNGVGRAFAEARPPDPAWLRERFGVTRPFLMSVGLMIPKKNQLTALRVWNRLADHGRRLDFVLVGEAGPMETELRWAARHNEHGRLITPGYVGEDDLARLYAGAEAFLFPSFHEGFGIPVVEAMAAGCPVIASSIPALAEVTGGVSPLFEPLDERGMTADAERLLADRVYREERVRRGRERSGLFSWDRSAATLLDLYRRLR